MLIGFWVSGGFDSDVGGPREGTAEDVDVWNSDVSDSCREKVNQVPHFEIAVGAWLSRECGCGRGYRSWLVWY